MSGFLKNKSKLIKNKNKKDQQLAKHILLTRADSKFYIIIPCNGNKKVFYFLQSPSCTVHRNAELEKVRLVDNRQPRYHITIRTVYVLVYCIMYSIPLQQSQ